MNGFALLWGKILDSSIWVKESKETRLVWIAMLAMKNSEGKIQASVIGLADRAKVSLDECRIALNVFLSPDPDDTSHVEEGRRILEIPGGWQIVNHDLYRFSTEAKREFWRQSKAEQRNQKRNPRKKALANPMKPISGDAQLRGNAEYQSAFNRGASQEELDEITTRNLPEHIQ